MKNVSCLVSSLICVFVFSIWHMFAHSLGGDKSWRMCGETGDTRRRRGGEKCVRKMEKILFFMFLHFNELSIAENIWRQKGRMSGGWRGVWVKIKQRNEWAGIKAEQKKNTQPSEGWRLDVTKKTAQCGRASQSGGRRLKTFQVFRFLFVETIKRESVARIKKKRSWKMNHNIFDCALSFNSVSYVLSHCVRSNSYIYGEYECDTQERPEPIHNRNNNDDMMWSDMFWRRSKLWTNQQKTLRENSFNSLFLLCWQNFEFLIVWTVFLSLWWREGFSRKQINFPALVFSSSALLFVFLCSLLCLSSLQWMFEYFAIFVWLYMLMLLLVYVMRVWIICH